MKDIRKTYPPTFKVNVVLDALKEENTSAELASQYRLNPSQIRTWKMNAKKGLLEVFKDQLSKNVEHNNEEELIQELYRQIGQLSVELAWLKKKSGLIS